MVCIYIKNYLLRYIQKQHAKKCPWYNVSEKYLNFGGSCVCGGKPTQNSQTISNEHSTSAKCLQPTIFLEDVRELPKIKNYLTCEKLYRKYDNIYSNLGIPYVQCVMCKH